MAVDPGTATIIAAGLGAAGNLFGGGSSGWSQQGAYNYDWRKLHQLQRWTAQNMRESRGWSVDDQSNFIQRRVNDARKAGLHPLFALGANSPQGVSALPAQGTGGPVFPGQADSGSFARDALREVGRGVRAYASLPNKHEQQQLRYERRLAQRLTESQIRETNARALAAAGTSARSVDPGVPSIGEHTESGIRLKPAGVLVEKPVHQRPQPKEGHYIRNFGGFGDLHVPGGHTAGHVEETGGEAMGFLHSLGLTIRAIGQDAWNELKYLGSGGKYGGHPWTGAPGERKKYRKGYRGRDGRIMR